MTLALWIVLTPLCLWVAICAVIWIMYFFFGGKEIDHSGDTGLFVIFLPILPFAMAYWKVKELLTGK